MSRWQRTRWRPRSTMPGTGRSWTRSGSATPITAPSTAPLSTRSLAVEADGAGHRDSGSVRDRDRLRKEHLERLGWRVNRLWSTSWFSDPEAELAKLQAAYTEAVRANPRTRPPPPPRSTTGTGA